MLGRLRPRCFKSRTRGQGWPAPRSVLLDWVRSLAAVPGGTWGRGEGGVRGENASESAAAPPGSDGVAAFLAGADAHDLLDRSHEDLAVADAARMGSRLDR